VSSFRLFFFDVGQSMPQLIDLCKTLSLLFVMSGVCGEEVMNCAKGGKAALSPFALARLAIE
jgi:hypothetical protein